MPMIEEVKNISIKTLIENETGNSFDKNNKLSECPFCGSGKGKKQSPAFSINIKENYYKCFSCGSQGSTIDFMMNLKKGWKERHAIKHLEEKYLKITFKPAVSEKIDDFQKTIYAISQNPVEKAKEYLAQRKINDKLLPIGSYMYDSIHDAVAFVDSDKKLINRRMIRVAKGSPKAKNQGTLNGSIYDKLFKPELDTVFLHEGVINALSMPRYSSLAIFSTENKIKNTSKLRKYVNGKKVVLAFDNDNAGNNCFEYYKTFLITNRFDIQSIRKLVFPENKDANDLLCSGGLDKYLNNKNNYKLVWEDILSKPIPKDSKDKRKDNKEHGFFMEKGCYYTEETIKGKTVTKKMSNFLMESIYHLTDGTKESRRVIKFQRNTNEILVSEIYSSELNLEKFKRVIRSIPERGLSFFGNTTQLDYILTFHYDREKMLKPYLNWGINPNMKFTVLPMHLSQKTTSFCFLINWAL